MSQESKLNLSVSRGNGSSDDPLVAAVDEYLAMLEAGESVDVESFVERYPNLGEELRNCLEGLDLVAHVSPNVADATDGQDFAGKNIGDFRIIREIGRGGMGVVYEAEQLSLGRSVALKVLPYAAMMDPKAITRFKNEARAAATLDHPHIVPVFAVGIERGIHYYAMSLIDGLTVAELISHLQRSITAPAGSNDRLSIDDFLDHHPSDNLSGSHLERTIDSGQTTKKSANGPTDHADETYRDVEAAISTYRSRFDGRFFRSVARLGAQAAEALDHAHQHGIVHRDIKPGNLIIDSGTKLWVTDFGLARIESDPGMTMTGDLVGTLRYMAPEQALAKRVVVDHRADIYSLGATLYELLALRTPFDAPSRETLLKQIAFEEPKPLRHFNRAVPEDLQTIVHKALSKNPDDRYATAEEMRYDLHAYVDDEPIKARPLSIAQRTTRWAAKRKGLVAAVAGVLILAVIGLLISNAMIAHERNVAQEAERSERTERLEADRQRKLADASAQTARETVDQYLTKVSDDQLLNAPSMQPLRKELLELALTYYKEFIQQQPDDPEVQSGLADAHERVGKITDEIGSTPDALTAHQRALAIRVRLTARRPENLHYQSKLADSYDAVAKLYRQIGNSEMALDSHNKAIELREELYHNAFDVLEYQSQLAATYAALGEFYLSARQIDAAIETQKKSVKIMEGIAQRMPGVTGYQHSLAQYLNNLGVMQWRNNRRKKAKDTMFNALKISEEIQRLKPEVLEYQSAIVAKYANLASFHHRLGEHTDALACYEKTIELQERFVRQNPKLHTGQANLATSYNNLGFFQRKIGKTDSALASFRRATEVREHLVATDPEVLEYQSVLSMSYYQLAETNKELGFFEESLDLHRRSLAIKEKLYDQSPEDAEYQFQLGMSNCRLSDSYGLLGLEDPTQALQFSRSGVALLEKVLEENSRVIRYRIGLAYAYFRRGGLLRAIGKSEDSAQEYAKLIGLSDGVGEQANSKNVWGYVGQGHYRLGHWEQAREALQKAIRLSGDEGPTVLGGFRWWYLTMTLHQLGEVEQARAYYDQLAAEFAKSPMERHPSIRAEAAQVLGIKERTDWNTLMLQKENIIESDRTAADWGRLGQAYYRTERFTEAKHAFEKNLELRGETEPTIKLGPRWWYMALLLARTGETDTARAHYDRLVSEMGNFTAADAQFRAELAALLGIEESEPAPTDGVSVSASAVRAAQRPDHSFNPVVDKPAYEHGAGPRVSVDSGHSNFHTVDGRYQGFAKVLEADGYQVRSHTSSLTADALAQLDLLVIANARSIDAGSGPTESSGDRSEDSAFSQVEIESLVDWARRGGSLLLIADHKPWGGAAKKLAAAMGVEMTDGIVIDDGRPDPIVFERSAGQLAIHPITDGRSSAERVDRVVTFTGQAFRTSGNFQPLLTLDEGSVLYSDRRALVSRETGQDVAGWLQGAAGQLGQGRVAVFGEAGMFSVQIGPSGRRMGMTAPGAEQNQQFLLNVMHWLSRKL